MNSCRICGHKLDVKIDLGFQSLTGYFMNTSDEVKKENLRLAKCSNVNCNVFQLYDMYNIEDYYGKDYGYESALNKSMIDHLKELIKNIKNIKFEINKWVDIGCNDGTLLSNVNIENCELIGVDPTAINFLDFYKNNDIKVHTEFYGGDNKNILQDCNEADVITSIAMFYDVIDPNSFIKQVSTNLSDKGIWVLELSYFPRLIENNAFDSICHEHIFYYKLEDIYKMLKKNNLEIIDANINDINGSSIEIIVSKLGVYQSKTAKINEILQNEQENNYDEMLDKLAKNIKKIAIEVKNIINDANLNGRNVYCLGASTKGNVLLQYFGLTSNEIKYIGEVNKKKFGKVTPGSNIPIVNEDDIIGDKNGLFIVLPWHFRENFIENTKYDGLELLFPFPEIERFIKK